MSNSEPTIKFTADLEIKAAGSAKPNVLIRAYRVGLLAVDAGEFVVDLLGLQLPESVPLLVDHLNAISGIVGQVRPVTDGKELTASGHITTAGEAGKEIIKLHKDSIRFQASIGARVISSERIPAGKTVTVNGREIQSSRPFRVARQSVLKEISVVVLGADNDGTQVDIAAKQKEKIMSTELELNEADVKKQERERLQQIEAVCKSPSGGWGENQKEVDDLRIKAINEDVTVETLQAGLLGILRSSRTKTPLTHTGEGAGGSSQEMLECRLMLHAGLQTIAEKEFSEEILEAADKSHLESMWDICRASLELSHVDVGGMRRDDLIQASLGGFSGGDIPQLLGNTINRVLLMAYAEAPATWQSFASIRSANDFKDHKSIRSTAFDTLNPMPEGGSMDHLDLGENTFTWSIDRFARVLRVDEIALINDDLNFLEETSPAMGRAAMRSVADNVYKTVMANSGAFFSSGNNNLETGGGSALDRASFITVLEKFLGRRNADGVDLDVMPKVLVVPPELMVTAKEILRSIELARTATTAGVATSNVLKDVLSLEVESRLSNTDRFSDASLTAWYVFAGPQDAGLILAFLKGRTLPRIRFFGIDQTVEQLAVSWTVDHNYGSTLADPVAGHKANGA